MNQDVKRGIIDQAQQQRMVKDTLILQKVNKAHREAFTQRFPTACEHMMRMVSERLQIALSNKPSKIDDLDTWTITPAEIRELSEALYYLSLISKEYPIVKED